MLYNLFMMTEKGSHFMVLIRVSLISLSLTYSLVPYISSNNIILLLPGAKIRVEILEIPLSGLSLLQLNLGLAPHVNNPVVVPYCFICNSFY